MALPLLGTGGSYYLHINHDVLEPSIAPILSGLQFHEIGTVRRGGSVNLSGPRSVMTNRIQFYGRWWLWKSDSLF